MLLLRGGCDVTCRQALILHTQRDQDTKRTGSWRFRGEAQHDGLQKVALNACFWIAAYCPHPSPAPSSLFFSRIIRAPLPWPQARGRGGKGGEGIEVGHLSRFHLLAYMSRDYLSGSGRISPCSISSCSNFRSAFTIILTSSSKETVGSQPSTRRALEGSATRRSTSAGRM